MNQVIEYFFHIVSHYHKHDPIVLDLIPHHFNQESTRPIL